MSICSRNINLKFYYIKTNIIKPIIRFSLVGIIAVSLIKLIIPQSNILSLFVFAFISIFSLIVLCYIIGLNEDEKKYVNRIFKKILKV